MISENSQKIVICRNLCRIIYNATIKLERIGDRSVNVVVIGPSIEMIKYKYTERYYIFVVGRQCGIAQSVVLRQQR